MNCGTIPDLLMENELFGHKRALLGINDKEALLGHPVIGMSWEGFVIS